MNTSLPLTIHDTGHGRTFLLLHGGAGPMSVIPFAERLSAAGDVRVVVPTHPGFSGTDRPDFMRTPSDLAARYLLLLSELDLHDVTIVGFSIGGWIASEMATSADPRIGQIVIVNGTGIQVDGHPVTDVSGMAPQEITALSYHDPTLAPNPADLPEPLRAQIIANIATVVSYGGSGAAPDLTARLAEVHTPTLVLWGESDGIASVEFGRAYAQAYANSHFELIPAAGHVPQIEQPELLATTLLAWEASLTQSS